MRTLSVALALLGAVGLLAGTALRAVQTADGLAMVALGLGALAWVALLVRHAQQLAAMVRGRSFAHGAGTVLTLLLVLVILVVAFLFFQRYRWRADWTAAGIHSLSPLSVQLLENLPRTVTVVGISTDQHPSWKTVPRLLSLYERHGGARFRVEMLDLYKDAAKLERYLEYIEGETVPLLLLTLEDEEATRVDLVREVSENALTNGLMRLRMQGRVNVQVTEGHGERRLDEEPGGRGMSLMAQALFERGYDTRPLPLVEFDQVPEQADILVIAGPQNEFYDQELAAIEAFLDRGGALMLMLDPQSVPQMARWAEDRFGVTIGHDLVVERDPNRWTDDRDPTQPFIGTFNPAHEITRGFHLRRERVAVQRTRSITPNEQPGPSLRVDWLMRSSPESWGETDWARLRGTGEVELDAADLRGPVTIATAVIREVTMPITPDGRSEMGVGESRCVIVGTSTVISDELMRQGALRGLMLNCFSWLSGQSDQISIPPRERGETRVELRQGQLFAVLLVCCLGVPGLFLIGAISVNIRRRMLA